jgi:uncharacterized protein YbjT (DUF2867 family)
MVTVIGATGNVGRALTEHLLQQGVRVRAVARTAQKLAGLAAKGAETCAGDLQNIDFLTGTFEGATAIFAMIPTHVAAPDMYADLRRSAMSLVEALKRAGVSRVVALSAVGAELPAGTGPMVGLHTFEKLLQALPQLGVVVLRATYFMENHLAGIPLIKQAGFYGGVVCSDLLHPMIAARDIAAVAAEYLMKSTFTGYTVRELLGPRDYTHQEAATILGAAIGRADLAYVQLTYEDFRRGLLTAGFSPDSAAKYVEMFVAFNAGRIQPTTARNAAITTATSLEQFAHESFVPAYQAS